MIDCLLLNLQVPFIYGTGQSHKTQSWNSKVTEICHFYHLILICSTYMSEFIIYRYVLTYVTFFPTLTWLARSIRHLDFKYVKWKTILLPENTWSDFKSHSWFFFVIYFFWYEILKSRWLRESPTYSWSTLSRILNLKAADFN